VHIEIFEKFSDFIKTDWEKLSTNRNPCLSYDFIESAEITGCVSNETGWKPRHLALFDNKGIIKAALLLYEKTHSWGEFVFDFTWAQAYRDNQLPYYPKLISCIPYTPISSNKILLTNPSDNESAEEIVNQAINLTNNHGFSSLHFHFVKLADLTLLESCGLLKRVDCQFHWFNNNYRSFDHFLGGLISKKRKKIKRERRKVQEQNIIFKWHYGSEISNEKWKTIYKLISMTFYKKGSSPYFSYDFFTEISKKLPHKIMVITANIKTNIIGAAIFFVDKNGLYGRYWGTDDGYDSLHFETCYYQGIDYCIKNNLKYFEPGTGGEHKISRGFIPRKTWSAHHLSNINFSNAIKSYLAKESQYIDKYIKNVEDHSPYKLEYK
jgi:predicted N-acyltransferase|tara:strand:+ start:961 stop:2100 length:1140 start_codon:yes stop_codon:yes gene_type:complete